VTLDTVDEARPQTRSLVGNVHMFSFMSSAACETLNGILAAFCNDIFRHRLHILSKYGDIGSSVAEANGSQQYVSSVAA